jgi:transglutaminase-like putative cysteine protease
MKQWLYGALVLLLTGCASANDGQSAAEKWEAERLRRIKIDFNKTEAEVKEYIRRYIPEVTDEQFVAWQNAGKLEFVEIEGRKRFFRNAAPNLFRIDSAAIAIKEAVDGKTISTSEPVNRDHVPDIIAAVEQTGSDTVLPVRLTVKYTLTVEPDVVPSGKYIRCWLPYPKDGQHRQKDVQLIAVSERNYTLAPDTCAHSTLYMTKPAIAGEPTVFSIAFAYTSYAEWHHLTPADVLPYDTASALYRTYTAECAPQIVFSPRIRALAAQLKGTETNPLLIARRIFRYVNDKFPWASAREYSTIPCIPEYVLDSGHGDCGQVTLLFMTLCRAVGIPVHWQSGFMTHPGAWNLHDWAEAYFEGVGWVPVDQSFGIPTFAKDEDEEWFFLGGIDRWRMIVNNDYSAPLYPEKRYPRSETVDFQRGEVEWDGGNLYFDQWDYNMEIEYPTDTRFP